MDKIRLEFVSNFRLNPEGMLERLPFAAQLGKTYSIEIQWEGQTFEAQNSMTPVYPFNPD